MYKYKTAIFDLDGTLLDTLEDLCDSVNAALRNYNCKERTLEEVRAFVGNGIRRLLELCVESGTAHPHFEEILAFFREDYKKNCRNKTKPYEGMEELLKQLKNDGVNVAVVSNKADFAVKDLNEYYFKGLDLIAIGEKETVKKKPAPDMVYQALDELSVSKEGAVYIGDSEVDLKTAENAGISCISVLWGFRSRQYLEEMGAKVFAETPDDILHYLKVE